MSKVKMSLVSVFVLCCSSAFVGAATFDKFAELLPAGAARALLESRLNALAADLGPAVALTGFHQATTLGGALPGLDIGVHTSYKNVSPSNEILSAVSAIVLPVIQVEFGLPSGTLDIIGRYASYDASTLTGVGLRHSVFKTLPADVSALALYNVLSVNTGGNKFSANVWTASLGINVNMPVVSPYAAVSYDSTTLQPDAAITTYTGSASAVRLDAGVNFGLLPLTYLNIGGSYIMSEAPSSAYRGGLGIKF